MRTGLVISTPHMPIQFFVASFFDSTLVLSLISAFSSIYLKAPYYLVFPFFAALFKSAILEVAKAWKCLDANRFGILSQEWDVPSYPTGNTTGIVSLYETAKLYPSTSCTYQSGNVSLSPLVNMDDVEQQSNRLSNSVCPRQLKTLRLGSFGFAASTFVMKASIRAWY